MTDWLSVLLSSVAVVIGVLVSYFVWVQAKRFHKENRAHDAEAYSRDRYDAIVELGVAILDAARGIQTSTSERWAHLVGLETVPDSPADDEGRLAGGGLLAVLETRAELLVLSDRLLPRPPQGADSESLTNAHRALRTESAWLVGDAHNALISTYGGPDYNPSVAATRAEITAGLVESSIQNISQRLLFGHANHVPYFREPGSPWPKAYDERVSTLLEDDPSASSDHVIQSSTAEQASILLATTIERFSTALFAVIDASDGADRTATMR